MSVNNRGLYSLAVSFLVVLTFFSISSLSQAYTCPICPPNPPSDLSATISTDGNGVSLSWADNSNNETEFKIYRGSTYISTVESGQNYYNEIFALTEEAIYTVTACNSYGCSDESNSAPVTTANTTTPGTTSGTTPPVITEVRAENITGAGAQIKWETDDYSNSKVLYGINASTLDTFSDNRCYDEINVTSHCINLTDLEPNTTYYYKIESMNSSGYDMHDYDHQFTSAASPISPEAPSNLNATVSENNIELTWTDNSNDETKFKIYRNQDFVSSVSANTTYYTDMNLPDSTYHYLITACNSYGCSDESNSVSVTLATTPETTPDDTTPPVVTDVHAENIIGSGAQIKWTTDDASDSRARYGLATSSLDFFSNSRCDNEGYVTNHCIKLTNLEPNTTYYYKVESMNADGYDTQDYDHQFTSIVHDTQSTEISTTTPETTTGDNSPPFITEISANNITMHKARIRWQTDDQATSRVRYGKNSSNLSLMSNNRCDSGGHVTNHCINLRNLDTDTTYYYKVESVNTNGHYSSDTGYWLTTTNNNEQGTTSAIPPAETESDIIDTTPPHIFNLTTDGTYGPIANIKWNTDDMSKSKVVYGTESGNYTSSSNHSCYDQGYTENHCITLRNLQPNTKYYYKAFAVNESELNTNSEERSFISAPGANYFNILQNSQEFLNPFSTSTINSYAEQFYPDTNKSDTTSDNFYLNQYLPTTTDTATPTDSRPNEDTLDGTTNWDADNFFKEILGEQKESDEKTNTITEFERRQECREISLSRSECEIFLELPQQCKDAKIINNEKCEQYIESISLPQECKDLEITTESQCKFYLLNKHLPKECIEAGALVPSACEQLMFARYALKWCDERGIDTSDEQICRDSMNAEYQEQIICDYGDLKQCDKTIRERHISNIVANEAVNENLRVAAEEIGDKTITINELENYIEESKKIIPITEGNTNIKIIVAKEEIVIDKKDKLIQTAPMMVMIDTDQDGLSDDMEKRMGTDPLNADTDNDGRTDGDEVKNNENPTGSGASTIILAPIDEAILQHKTLEHPKTKGEISEVLIVEKVENITKEIYSGTTEAEEKLETKTVGYSLSGKAEPNSTITLYIYSDLPVIVTVKADEYGNWKYELNKSLTEGEHEIYAVVNDNTGKVVNKSNPLTFFVKEAQAFSLQEFLDEGAPVATTDESESALQLYVIGAILAAAAGIFLFLVGLTTHRNKNQTTI